METDATMKMIREIRDRNSMRRINMTQEQRREEDRVAREWFQSQISRLLNTLHPTPRKLRAAQ